MIHDVIVIGSGSAGLMAALALKRKIPRVRVRIIRDPDMGVIGVGEGTTPNFPALIFNYLGIPRKLFYDLAEPTWKLGIRFLWGPRGRFDYTFAPQLDARLADLPRPNGFYGEDEFSHMSAPSSLMTEGKVFPRQANGCPDIQPWHAFHIENEKFVAMLEKIAESSGVEMMDGKVTGFDRNDTGVTALHLGDGRKLTADFFVDCSGFRSELLGKFLEEPFVDFDKTLFCDRAVVGGWDRTDEPILPYTTAEQMSTGWSWQIEHEHRINRGYVYCSDMIPDDQAAAEFKQCSPKLPDALRVVKFSSGCRKRTWVDNVVAIGNSAGFVEPLEATALMVASIHIQTLVDMLIHSELTPTPTLRDLYNEVTHRTWLDIRDFLGLHYKPNTALDTPFWRRCREETDLSGIQGLLDFYQENGPTGLARYRLPASHFQNDFGIEGYFVMLVGQKVPYRNHHRPSPSELAIWNEYRNDNRKKAGQGMTVEEALQYVRHPGWQWHADQPLKR